MKSFKRSGFVIFFLVFSFFLGQKKESSAAENKKLVIKVGVYNEPPEIFLDSNSNPKGVFIDILEYISKNEKLNIEYIQGDWHTLLDKLKSGEIDILPNVSCTGERDSVFLLNEIPILTSWLELFTNNQACFSSFDDLNNKKVGVLKNSIAQEYLDSFLKSNINLSIQSVVYTDYPGMVLSLKNKKIDVFIADRFFHYSEFGQNDILSTGVTFKPVSLHFAFTNNVNNKYLVNIFDKNISKLRSTADSEYYKIVYRWLGRYYKNFIPVYFELIIIVLIIVLTVSLLYALITKYDIRNKNKSLRLSNEALIKATEAAKESDRLKTAFLLNISHEIRTPMNGILGFMNLLQEPDLDSETRNEFIHLVNLSGQRLLNTVDEIIEISKIESGSQETNNTIVDISNLMKYIVGLFKPKASEKGISIEISEEHMTGENALILADNTKLKRILSNLVNNAIKFTEKGRIEIGSYQEEGLVFFVKDTGIGIPANCLETIFDRFVQAENYLSKTHQGMGLGLTIAKAYVESLRGKIWVNSEMGKGSVFFFSIPYVPVKYNKIAEGEGREIVHNETILIAEDDRINFLYYKYILQKEGFKVIHAINGKSAIESLQENHVISLILMDIKMPVMDGFEATKQIRQFNKTIPIIGQSAYGFISDRKKAINAGCSDYISKPIDNEKLISLIKKHLA